MRTLLKSHVLFAERVIRISLIIFGLCHAITAHSYSTSNAQEREELVAVELELHKMISFAGTLAISWMGDMDEQIDFGNSDDWALARGDAESGSFTCADGGGYDLTIRRDSVSFTKLTGTLTAADCKYEGITANGSLTFEYEDTYYEQDSPRINFPLKMTFSNFKAREGGLLGQSYTYSGDLFCDVAYNRPAISQAPLEEKLDTYDRVSLIIKFYFGSGFDRDPNASPTSLYQNNDGSTSTTPVYNPNCDFKNVSVDAANSIHTIVDAKYIALSYYWAEDYIISESRDELLRKARDGDGDDAATLTLYTTSDEGIDVWWGFFPQPTISVRHATKGDLYFIASGVNKVSDYSESLADGTQVSQWLSSKETLNLTTNGFPINPDGSNILYWFSFDNENDGISNAARGPMALSRLARSGQCPTQFARPFNVGDYENASNSLSYTLFVQQTASVEGQDFCEVRTGFYLQEPDGEIQYQDLNGDGNNELFSLDDDQDGAPDEWDPFPLDPTEWEDTDFDGIGNNADGDDDGDGVVDELDAFPLDSSETTDTDLDGIGNNADADDDGDGVSDGSDAFPLDPSETTDTDADGIGNNADPDDDGDGVSDGSDAFPFDQTEWDDSDGDGVGNNSDSFPTDPSETADSDGDGVGNNADAFPYNASETIDTDSDGVGDNADIFPNDPLESVDSDGDGVGDNADAFPSNALETADSDGDGIGDNTDIFPNDPLESVDSDGDGVGDNADAFPSNASETADTDGDGIGDNTDVFPADANESIDSDSDGIGDNSDTDDDNDGTSDDDDAFPLDATEQLDSDGDGVGDNADQMPLDASETLDADGDGIGNNADPDDDNDGFLDVADELPFDPTERLDTDSDGIGNNADSDDDNDGLSDAEEVTYGTNPLLADTDGDGFSDKDEVDDNTDPLDKDDGPSSGGLDWFLIKAAKDQQEAASE